MAATEEASTASRSQPKSQGEDEEAMAVLDFDMLCASVAMSAERRKGAAGLAAAASEGPGGGVQRMWEGDVVIDCFDDQRIALEAACCPCYRFGKNMRRANLGSCFFQAMAYFISLVAVLVSLIAFSVTRHHVYLYMGLGSVILIAIYTGYFRRRIRKQFNILGTDSSLDDCVLHLICPCCTLCQEARTLEMNNVQCGVWHGRGDTICLGSNGEGNKAFAALHKSSFVPIKSPELCGMDRISSGADEHQPLVPSVQLEQE
ncbi:cell number regulator 2-like [Lolium rigidum]|uniref:cell number regulator 2-like n=1 Tax=Lolium rigidum TaxID=89674 RepID=UPI001F5D5E68|nr:cell number regulator 2-like [Lolium rigidum]